MSAFGRRNASFWAIKQPEDRKMANIRARTTMQSSQFILGNQEEDRLGMGPVQLNRAQP